MNKNEFQEKEKRNKNLTDQLKSRLFEKGFSYGTLPSVKRQMKYNPDYDTKNANLIVSLGKNSQLHPQILKQQSTVFRKNSTSKIKTKIEQIRQEDQSNNHQLLVATNRNSTNKLSRQSSRKTERQSGVQAKISHNTYKLMSSTAQNFRKQKFALLIPQVEGNRKQIERAKTAKVNEIQSQRTKIFMQKISGKHQVNKNFEEKLQKTIKVQDHNSQKFIRIIPNQENFIPVRPVKQLDRYINLILKNVAHVDEFVYLRKSKHYEEDPYDLQVIDYSSLKKAQKQGMNEYFTISRKGLCLYEDCNPKEFQLLSHWLQERNSFDRIKSLNFFKQFRRWKTLKMWHKIIMSQRIHVYSQMLKQKLFFLNGNLREVILNVRSEIFALEDLRIVSYKKNNLYENDNTFSLEQFSKVQRKVRQSVKDKIKSCSVTCRKFVKEGFNSGINNLRIITKSSFSKPDETRKKLPKNYKPSTKEQAYEKLQFPNTMDYEMRSKLRSQCMKFIKFSYLMDFIAMHSLKIIYDRSLNEFQEHITIKKSSQQIFIAKESFKDVKSTLEPIFKVSMILEASNNLSTKIINLQPCLFPPTGTNTISDFKILAHVNLKVPKTKKGKGKELSDSQYEQLTSYSMQTPDKLCPQWIHLSPCSDQYSIEINNCFQQGLESLGSFQRWSRHESMKVYIDALEEWDDKISTEHLQDINLHPEDWIDITWSQKNKKKIKDKLIQSFNDNQLYINEVYEKYLQFYWEDQKIDYSLFINPILDDPSESINNTLQNLIYQKNLFTFQLPYLFDKQILRVDSTALKEKLLPTPIQCFNKIYLLLPPYISQLKKQISKYLEDSILALRLSATNVSDFVQQIKSLKRIDKKLPKVKDRISFISQVIGIMQNLKTHIKSGLQKDVSKVWKSFETSLLQDMMNLQNVISKVQESAQHNMIRFAQQVSKTIIPNLNKQISRVDNLVQQKKFLTFDITIQQAIEQLQQYDLSVQKYEGDAKKCSLYELTLNMSETRFQNLEILRSNLSSRLEMWKGLKNWQELSSVWMNTIFQQIDVEQIKQFCEKFTKIISKCTKKLPPNPVLETLRKLLSTFKDAMPVVMALSTRIVQEDPQYWGEIQKIVGFQFIITKQFKLSDLIQKKFHVFQNQIIQIATFAKQEQTLKMQIQQNKSRWMKLEFASKQYKLDDPKNKESYILVNIDQLYVELDEILANFSSILGNRYLKRHRAQAEDLQKTIYNATLIIDDWLVVQKNWIYLENIFSSSDIKSKLRQQNIKFQSVDKNFKNHMRSTYRSKYVYKNLGNHDLWIRYKDILAQIQKQLEKYLQEKRNQFPRFYFLSNDQLIEILAKANDLDAIQKNIKKCFECVNKIVFQSNSRYIESLFSIQGQNFRISRTNIAAKGEIQNWLKTFENAIDESMRKYIAKGFVQFDQSKNRLSFITTHISQVVLVVAQINWTLDTEAFLDNLEQYYKMLLKQLSQLTNLIRDPGLNPLIRRTLIALITQDVHNRDIVQSLMAVQGTVSKSDFIWSQQLRFYVQGQGIQINVLVKQINAEILYGYQYLGVMSRLVITPLTDRCWMTIIGAINIKLGAAPAGPAGTGKTQSTKDLAKGLGMLCVVFNCSEQIEYKIMGRLFSGLAQQGAWSCLDQFNRIDIQVLSVIAQQLLTIRVAKLQGEQTFYFIDRLINLKSNCGVFITMNPGYAGRTELPDNLKVLFRSVSMMIPDYKLIAEIMLFAQGFEDAKNLSRKMVQLYKLSSDQLSQQDHYDFGMRAVKSVLVMAGSLKRADKNVSQDEVLIKAMRNSNIPKFLKDDLPLFEALISDLFPKTQIKQTQYHVLKNQINDVCEQLKLQIVPSLTKKAIQLYETFNVRFGVMIVGNTNSGKTTCSELLAKAMSSLRKKQHEDQTYKLVRKHTLNPKAISMGQLYGQINVLTQEWSDGLVSSIMRDCSNEQDPNQMNWIVLDGPVDSLWIENMNTVLDDNMMLCLANGQRIKLISSMKMLFEVMDLKVASPATVSRCGMVYIIAEDLGWKPLILSWLNKWIAKIKKQDSDQFWQSEMKLYILQLFQKSIDIIFKYINKKAKESIPTSSLQLSQSLANLFEATCNQDYGFKIGQQRQYKKKYVTYCFIYSFIWSTCVTTSDKFHEDLSFQCRSIFDTIVYPNNDMVQNFSFDSNDVCFKHWNQKLPNFIYNKQQPYFEIIVETIDTVRYSHIISLLCRQLKPVLITGASGTGKSIQLSRIDNASLVLTSTTSHYQLQLSVEGKLQKLRKNTLGAPPGSVCVVAIDDTNMPAQEKFGAMPAVQVLRTILDKGGVWDRKEKFWKCIQRTALLCACSPPGGGRNQLTPRFIRHFNLMCLPEPSHQSLTRIYKQIVDGFFNANQFMEIIKKCSGNLVSSTIEIYTIIKKQKLPIPSKFHYTFNLRDVSKIIQGILQAKKSTIKDVESLGKLWFHQCCRILKDRLNTTADHEWFEQKLQELLHVTFRVQKKQDNIYFSNIMKLQTNQYQEITDLKKVLPIIEQFQEDHNSEKQSKLQLVFFTEAIENILRIERILSLSRGNGLLLGVSGSGKQSLTRLASFINKYEVKQIEIVKGYNIQSFRTFIKSLMRSCSDSNQFTTFLFTDNQIIKQSFLQDINNILNSGQVPSLWEIQEKEQIINSTRSFNSALKRPQSPQTIYRTFVQRVRQRLHVILSMSPIGDALRIRCRKFPALVNCCIMNWFFAWPEQALTNVATAILNNYDHFPIYQNIPKKSDVIDIYAEICKQVHLSANQEAKKFEETLKRKVYNTPKSYLDMLKLYIILLNKKQNQVFQKKDRLTGGLNKLQKASKQVIQLEQNLIKLKPQLEQQSLMLTKALKKVQIDSQIALDIEMTVSAEANEANQQKDQIQILTDEARDRLKEVQPELQRAAKAVQTIDRKALQTIRNYPKPPAIVQTIMEGVCILFGIKGDWEVQKKLLLKLDDFITSLKEYKKDTIPDDRLMKLKNQLQKNQFKEQVIIKKVRQMLQIAQWCKAIEKYAVVAKQIAPKRKKMLELNVKLSRTNKELIQKMAVLKEAQDNVTKLKNQTDQMIFRKKKLEKQLQLTKDRLERAANLTVLTKDQAIRWALTVQKMTDQIKNIPADVFICTAAISYNGPFTGTFRKNLIDYWTTVVSAKDIPMTNDFQISKVLGDPLVIRDWKIDGLPSDTVSLQNAIFSMQGIRWPLLIDPQEQAWKWQNRMLSRQKKVITKLNKPTFLSEMKASIKNGIPVLLQDIEGTLPAVLDTIFSKQVQQIDNMPTIKFGDQNIYYDYKFKVFMFTKNANPNFLPEVFIRVNIINFTVTFEGLKQQLLGMVVKHQRQEIEQKRDENIVKMGEYNKCINETELSILRLLAKANAETILDDIQLIDTLRTSQKTNAQIKIKIEESDALEEIITKIRQQYISVSTRGSVLFFVIKDLFQIDTMYQYSLQYIEKIFHNSMQNAENNQVLEKRLNNLVHTITSDIYKNVARGLFGKDKILFSFIIATSINKQQKIISEDLWTSFTRGGGAYNLENAKINPNKNLFTNKAWQLALYLEQAFAKFTGLVKSLSEKTKIWESYVEKNDMNNTLPDNWDNNLDLFDKVVLMRVIQPQRIVNSMSHYIINTIGPFYLQSPNATMKDIWKDSDCRTPIIFVLSPAADPTSALLKFAKETNNQLQIISLGQGQGIPAQNLIKKGKETGKWVLLQNCHLARTWLHNLEKIVGDNLNMNQQIALDFRLFLTSMPAAYFPASILQNGIKLTTEPPSGIKANLKRSWNDIDEQFLNSCPDKSEALHKMLWGLTYFHAIIQQRQKFGPLGWNIKYEFNQSDLQTSKTVLQMLLSTSNQVPFEALLFVTGQINYGGRVTDDWDRRCLMTILHNFYNLSILQPKYTFSKSSQYFIPEYQNIQNYRSYIDTLPFNQTAMIFGMHNNANNSYLQQQQIIVMETLLMMQPRDLSGSEKNSQQIILEIVTNMLDKKEVPQLLDINIGHKDLFIKDSKGLSPSLSTFLLQEIQRFNILLKVLKSSLEDLKKAINGLILMSDQLDSMFYSILNNKVPSQWEKVAYPNLKPLSSWMKDLKERVIFIRQWLIQGSVNSFWLSSFYFPQGFLTGVLQEFARQPDKQIPIDELAFCFKFTDLSKQRCVSKPNEGVFINGLILEGGGWDSSKKILIDPLKNQMLTILPVIHFQPIRQDEKKPNYKYENYLCPVYKTSVRAGILSTTGQSTNFVLAVDMPSIQQSDYWVLQGTAILLQLNE